MLEKLIVIFFVIGVLTAIFVSPMFFMRGVYELEYGSLEAKDKFKSYIPIWNIASAECVYTGRKFSFTALFTLLSFGFFALRFILVATMVANTAIHYVTIYGLFIFVIAAYISNVVLVFKIIHEAGTKGMVGTLVNAIIFPLGQYYIGNTLGSEVKWQMKQEETF